MSQRKENGTEYGGPAKTLKQASPGRSPGSPVHTVRLNSLKSGKERKVPAAQLHTYTHSYAKSYSKERVVSRPVWDTAGPIGSQPSD